MNTTHTNSRDHMMQILAVIERGEGESKKGFWTRIGVAFQNRDQSWNLRFDFIPTRMGETTIQLRPFDAKPEDGAAEPEPAPEPARLAPAPESATAARRASNAVGVTRRPVDDSDRSPLTFCRASTDVHVHEGLLVFDPPGPHFALQRRIDVELGTRIGELWKECART